MSTTRCTARVIELRSTGTRINNQPELWFALEVERGTGRYRAETVTVVPVEWMPRVQPGSTVQVEVDSANPALVRIDLSGHEPATTVADAKPVALEGPLWLLGWRSPRPWLMPWTTPGLFAVQALSNTSGRDADQKLAPGLWLAWAEQLGLSTRIETHGVIWLVPGKQLVGYMPGAPMPFDRFGPNLAQLGKPVTGVLWGDLGADPDGVVLHMHAVPRNVEIVRTATYASAPSVFTGWLRELGLGGSVALPPWYAPLPASLVDSYAAALEKNLCLMLADRRLLPAQRVAYYTAAFDLAVQLGQQTGAPPQCRVFPLTIALFAAKAGCLDDAHRDHALDIVRRATDPADVVARLSPHFYRALGMTADADAADRRARASAGGDAAYLAWLDAVARPE